jgi:hypothetical protein
MPTPPWATDLVDVGSCRTLYAKIIGGPRPKKYNRAREEYFNKHDCLAIEMHFIQSKCKCERGGQEFKADAEVADKTIEAFRRLSAAVKKIRGKAIKNPVIKKYVDEVSEIKDCYSEATIKVMETTFRKLEMIAGE